MFRQIEKSISQGGSEAGWVVGWQGDELKCNEIRPGTTVHETLSLEGGL